MNSRRFHQAGMKKCQAGKEEMQAEWCRSNAGDQEFRYGIAKISQGLRKFRNPSEISLWLNFLYDSEFEISLS